MAKQIIRSIPIDFRAIAKDTEIRRGKICRSTILDAWVVQDVDVPHLAIIDKSLLPDIGDCEELRISAGGKSWEVWK